MQHRYETNKKQAKFRRGDQLPFSKDLIKAQTKSNKAGEGRNEPHTGLYQPAEASDQQYVKFVGE